MLELHQLAELRKYLKSVVLLTLSLLIHASSSSE